MVTDFQSFHNYQADQTVNGTKPIYQTIIANTYMNISFWGATEQVTGSLFLLEISSEFRVLIDCGLDMDQSTETMPAYPGSSLPVDASMINAVILTHAHLDHSGRLPNLVKEGFEGKIYCTPPTRYLTELLLEDSAQLNRKKFNQYQKKRRTNPGFVPKFNLQDIYLEKNVKETLELFRTVAFESPFRLANNVTLTFLPTGHLLGAANILLEVKENGQTKRILFSGDIGRRNYPLLPDPVVPPPVDYMICETTYADRLHESTQATEQALQEVIMQACVEKRGTLIIPAFSIGRTQAIIFTLGKLYTQNRVPAIPVYADSPLAQRSNRVYERFFKQLNEEAQAHVAAGESLLHFDSLHYVDSDKESKVLMGKASPKIIISSSGMLEGGRILHHLRAGLSDANCTVLMVGYSTEGTLGNKLIKKARKVKMGKAEIEVKATLLKTDAFSGHGDQNDLLRFIGSQSKQTLKKLFLVHGEKESMHTFQSMLSQKGFEGVTVPQKGQIFSL